MRRWVLGVALAAPSVTVPGAKFATCPSDRFMGGVIMSSTAAQDISCRPSLAAIARAATTRFGGPRTERSPPPRDICKTSTRASPGAR